MSTSSQNPEIAPPGITLSVSRDGWTEGIQLSIGDSSSGYRLAGPKFNGSSKNLVSRTLDAGDAEEIRKFLDAGFPQGGAAAVRTQTLNEVRRALLGTTDGDEIHESSEIPAAEIARIIEDLGGAR